MNYRIIFHTLGWVLNIESVCMLLPLACACIYKESDVFAFLISIGLCLILGVPLVLKKPKSRSMYAKEGFVIVALSWIVMSVFGALPFMITGAIPSFADAFFETVSGFTTTGASILTDVEALSKSLMFWRCFTHWIGGMGVLVFLVALLPLCGGSNLHLMRAESTGPSVSKLVPKIGATAKILYGIYTVITLIQIVLLLFSGMGVYESLTISFATAGTGGFSMKNSSMSEYSSYVQIVVTIFMILFGVNFSVYYLILIRRFKEAFSSSEVKAYILVIAASTLVIAINILHMFDSFGEALKHSAFQVGSIITTTGFMSNDFDKWPELSKVILVMLMFIGACAGSTGGGLKISRMLIILKTVTKELRIAVHPKRVHKISMNGRTVEHETIRTVNVYIMSFAFLYALSLLIISVDNFDFTTNFTAVAATINNVGPGLGGVGPTSNFSAYSALSKIILSFDMLAGRLEMFPLLMLFSPYTYKK